MAVVQLSGLVAYPSDPSELGPTIIAAVQRARMNQPRITLESWEENDIAGRFLVQPVLEKITSGNLFVADITRLNFNVTFEIGFAIAKKKRIFLIRNTALVPEDRIREVGIFDTLGYESYSTSDELREKLEDIQDIEPIAVDLGSINQRAPVYVVLPRVKSDAEIRLVARIKKARLQFRSFDAEELGRLPANEAVENVAASYGVAAILLPTHRIDHLAHNIRVAFIAGLAFGFDRARLLLQQGEDPVPLDYRDFVGSFLFPDQINDAVAEFHSHISASFQRFQAPLLVAPKTFLETLNLGAAAAENELQQLGHYYLETDEYTRVLRGEVRVVTGRKGAGKTALFFQVRNRLRGDKRLLVLDLKPEGFQLLKFKERVLDFLEEGAREHTITAFWEYLLLLETCQKILTNDNERHLRDHRLYEPYRELSDAYHEDQFIQEGDFSERMLKLTQRIADDFGALTGEGERDLWGAAQVTEVLYKHDIAALRARVVDYLQLKDGLWILFDNLDKGWPPHGVTAADVLTLRTLLDAIGKIERDLQRRDVPSHAVVFLRNDVYELLVDQTPDRGKTPSVTLDWTDPEMLREVLRRRFNFSPEIQSEPSFDEVWRQVAAGHVSGEESSQYLIDRCLMRPRSLIELLRYCRSHAVNLGHDRIELEDFVAGEEAYSADVITNISYEMRDISPNAEDLLYEFIEGPKILNGEEVRLILSGRGQGKEWEEFLNLLLWYGFFGLVRGAEVPTYIYSVAYDMRRLRALVERRGIKESSFAINPAFWRALELKE